MNIEIRSGRFKIATVVGVNAFENSLGIANGSLIGKVVFCPTIDPVRIFPVIDIDREGEDVEGSPEDADVFDLLATERTGIFKFEIFSSKKSIS